MAETAICPDCRGNVDPEAKKCRHCAGDLPSKTEAYIQIAIGLVLLPVSLVFLYLTWTAVGIGSDLLLVFNFLEVLIWGAVIGFLLAVGLIGPVMISKGAEQLSEYKEMMEPTGDSGFSQEKQILRTIGKAFGIVEHGTRTVIRRLKSLQKGEKANQHSAINDRLHWEFERIHEQPYEHYSEAIDEIRRLQREGDNRRAEELLLWCIDFAEAEAKAKDRGGLPPAYYHRLISLYRTQERYREELQILERYVTLSKELGQTPDQSRVERLSELREIVDSLEKTSKKVEQEGSNRSFNVNIPDLPNLSMPSLNIPGWVWPIGVIAGCILWLSLWGLLNHETMFGIALFGGWIVLPITLYFDSRKVRKNSDWSPRVWLYVLISIIPLIAPAGGFFWMYRRKKFVGRYIS